ncbi:MAG TPA: hypothetical protein VGM90_15725 [Kofleriaceae bacterium]|jgi:hypothetical protein
MTKTAPPPAATDKTEHLKTLAAQRARNAAKLLKRRRMKSGQPTK